MDAMGPFAGAPRLVAGGRSRMLPSLSCVLRTLVRRKYRTSQRLLQPLKPE